MILEQHRRMLQRLLELAAKPEEARLDELNVVLIGHLDRQAGILQRMEAWLGQIGTAVEQPGAAVAHREVITAGAERENAYLPG